MRGKLSALKYFGTICACDRLFIYIDIEGQANTTTRTMSCDHELKNDGLSYLIS